jgi:hypothetical protein
MFNPWTCKMHSLTCKNQPPGFSQAAFDASVKALLQDAHPAAIPTAAMRPFYVNFATKEHAESFYSKLGPHYQLTDRRIFRVGGWLLEVLAPTTKQLLTQARASVAAVSVAAAPPAVMAAPPAVMAAPATEYECTTVEAAWISHMAPLLLSKHGVTVSWPATGRVRLQAGDRDAITRVEKLLLSLQCTQTSLANDDGAIVRMAISDVLTEFPLVRIMTFGGAALYVLGPERDVFRAKQLYTELV